MKRKLLLQCAFVFLLTLTICAVCRVPSQAAEMKTKNGWTYYEENSTIYIDSYTFSDSSVTELKIPDTINGKPVVSVGGIRSTKLKKVVMGANVKTIEQAAFQGCTALQSIDTQNVTEVGEGAFYGCSSLKTAYLPKVKYLGYMAIFEGCSKLETVYLSSATEVYLSDNSAMFIGCTNLKAIVMPKVKELDLNEGGTTYIPKSLKIVCMPDTVYAKYKSLLPSGVKNHSCGSWKTTKQPTVLAKGKSTRSCIYCNKTFNTRTLSKLKATIKLSKTTVTVKVKKSVKIKVSGLARGDSVKSWKSANKKIAVVTSKGKITGKKKGKTKITVTLKSGLKKKITVKVK